MDYMLSKQNALQYCLVLTTKKAFLAVLTSYCAFTISFAIFFK